MFLAGLVRLPNTPSAAARKYDTKNKEFQRLLNIINKTDQGSYKIDPIKKAYGIDTTKDIQRKMAKDKNQ